MVRCSQYDALVEMATICALCNDSSLDYNEVWTCIYAHKHINIRVNRNTSTVEQMFGNQL